LKTSPLKEDRLRRLVATNNLFQETAHFFAIGEKFGGYFDYPLLKSKEFH